MVRVELRDDIGVGVWLWTLDRPERRNAVDLATLDALAAAQADLRSVPTRDARVVVLTGAPPAFCAGADLHGVEDDEFAERLGQVLLGFTSLPCTVLAAIDGPALGAGTQLALACDLRIATPSSRFGIPAAKLGLAVDHWTVERLAREAGWSTARAMLLAAETVDAEHLHRGGAVHRLGDLDDALEWAGRLCELAPLTVAAHKLALERSGPPPAPDPEVEAARHAAWASADAIEGRTAFLDKRTPEFRGG